MSLRKVAGTLHSPMGIAQGSYNLVCGKCCLLSSIFHHLDLQVLRCQVQSGKGVHHFPLSPSYHGENALYRWNLYWVDPLWQLFHREILV